MVAILLYKAGLLVSAHAALSSAAVPTGIRLVSYVLAGATVGYFASRARQMMSESLRVIDELLVLARRDLPTGLASGDDFHAAINRRLAAGMPFVLLVGEIHAARRRRMQLPDGALRDVARSLAAHLDEGDELTRVGPRQFAVLRDHTAGRGADEAEQLERALAADGYPITFGLAIDSAQAGDALSLFQAANERLYARRAAHDG